MDINIKRVYEAPSSSDGKRVLVDRLWPRGLTKDKAKVDLWLKDISPSTQLRKWFNHDLAKWPEFQEKFREELDANPEPVEQLRQLAKDHKLTMVYGAKDKEHNDAVVILGYLKAVD
ncbi:DUF488 domain-containing protein [Candidatus Saccharibacteria bacterium]|nr:DUF488 domain-containing protein [Candidatus Saccharibacteria bacterium]